MKACWSHLFCLLILPALFLENLSICATALFPALSPSSSALSSHSSHMGSFSRLWIAFGSEEECIPLCTCRTSQSTLQHRDCERGEDGDCGLASVRWSSLPSGWYFHQYFLFHQAFHADLVPSDLCQSSSRGVDWCQVSLWYRCIVGQVPSQA